MLQGKKTHIVALGVVIAALVSFAAGDATLIETLNQILIGTGISALRIGVDSAGAVGGFLQGKKTHILAFGAVASAVVAYLTGETTLAEAVNSGLIGAGLSTLRAGVASAKTSG